MRFTRFSDIGLRVRIYLERAGERPHPVVGQLAKLGWITATRGRKGGLRLAADPALLTIGQVLRKLEGEDDELVDCAACCAPGCAPSTRRWTATRWPTPPWARPANR